MDFIQLLFIGIFTAIIGTSIPGLLNMTVVKIGKQEGEKSAYSFILGASITIAIQVYLAIFFAKFINFNAEVTKIFREMLMALLFSILLKNGALKGTQPNLGYSLDP